MLQEVENFRHEYARSQPERMLGAPHHFGAYRPTRLETTAAPRTPAVEVYKPQQSAGKLNMLSLSPKPTQETPPLASTSSPQMRHRRAQNAGLVPHNLANRWDAD